MEIRLGDLNDLTACLAMDDSYETDYVWQMEEQDLDGSITVTFRQSRLPRPMRVRGIVPDEDLANRREGNANLIVAEDGSIRGFINSTASEWNQVARINNLVVDPAYRRRGIGSELLRTALDWARQEKMRLVLFDTFTKDYPAICLCQKHGFTFCGFNDKVSPNRDIAVYFAYTLR